MIQAAAPGAWATIGKTWQLRERERRESPASACCRLAKAASGSPELAMARRQTRRSVVRVAKAASGFAGARDGQATDQEVCRTRGEGRVRFAGARDGQAIGSKNPGLPAGLAS
jgi:hypothetical protein